jgi:hypothetical protein
VKNNFNTHETWDTVGILIGENPTPRHFPALRISVRTVRRHDRSYKDGFSYTCGLVDARDDVNGATFRPVTHIRDTNVVAYLELLRKGATMVAELAGKADKEAKGTFTGSLGDIAASKPTNGTGKRARP